MNSDGALPVTSVDAANTSPASFHRLPAPGTAVEDDSIPAVVEMLDNEAKQPQDAREAATDAQPPQRVPDDAQQSTANEASSPGDSEGKGGVYMRCLVP